MPPDLRLGYLVFEVRRPSRWTAFCARMLGLPPPSSNTDGNAALCGARRVRRLHRCADPCGNAIELFTGAAAAAAPFASAAFPQGFRTGDLGLGHAVLVAHDLESMEAFYVGLLGFGVTERLATRGGPIAGVAFERARRHKVPLSLELGQHPDPDGTFSFYGVTPSGFDFEIGAGTQTIEPAGWETHHTDVTSAWGHKPKLRLQLKMAAGLIARKMGAASQPAKALS